jgi:hypothetical protein
MNGHISLANGFTWAWDLYAAPVIGLKTRTVT